MWILFTITGTTSCVQNAILDYNHRGTCRSIASRRGAWFSLKKCGGSKSYATEVSLSETQETTAAPLRTSPLEIDRQNSTASSSVAFRVSPKLRRTNVMHAQAIRLFPSI